MKVLVRQNLFLIDYHPVQMNGLDGISLNIPRTSDGYSLEPAEAERHANETVYWKFSIEPS